MTRLAFLTQSDGRETLARALRGWLPAQRWFAGKARRLVDLVVEDVLLLDSDIVDVLVLVRYADGPEEYYQVPLAVARADAGADALVVDALVVDRPPVRLVDALADADACLALARLVGDRTERKTEAGATVRGEPVTGALPDGERVRRLGAEQSNSSVVFDERFILKVFRRLEAGQNPDVEVTRGLTEAGFAHVPAQHGALVLADGFSATLAVLGDFCAGAREGWALALEELERVSAKPDRPQPLLDGIEELGRTVASMHRHLHECFASRQARRDDLEGWGARMRRDAEEVVALAARQAADAAAPVVDRQAELHQRLAAVAAVEDAGVLIRVHGDLHLGQVLRDAEGRWQILDFEGEPARSLAERRAPATPLRDVAGMLRSFDYAAASAQRPGPGVGRWRDEARRRFLAGYLDEARPAGLVPRSEADLHRLLTAFELDKAVYELGYELANRPDWVPIPVAGILRVLDTPDRPIDDPREPAVRRRTLEDDATAWRADPAEVRALVEQRHADPHRLLGLHPIDDEHGVVRTYRPAAEQVEVLVDGREPVAAVRTHDAGFFEALLDVRPDPSAYRLRVTYPGGQSFELHDPYAFWPTLGEVDLHLAGEGRHEELWRRMGAHATTVEGISGTAFAVWAPNARSIRVVGDFNSWDGRLHPMRLLGGSGIWELFVPDVGPGAYYKYELVTAAGDLVTRADPYAFATEVPPGTASRVFTSTYEWNDADWYARQRDHDPIAAPLSVYELHLGSWRHTDGRPLTYRELADQLPGHVRYLGFTHVELLPAAEHPFGGSWGYQVTGYYAPTARFGTPDDFRFLVDTLHQHGIGVIVDWVPAHFPRDEWALARYDGTALYEHMDPRQGEHPDWGTLVFNFGRNEVRNFLIANALFWLEELHVDGLRVDAVASMLYLDYSRQEGQWVPNKFGGRENLEAVEFLKELNMVVYKRNPHTLMIAEESTAWPGVSRPTYLGGLGFGFKWNMGWMHDTLSYFSRDPIYRRHHHNELTFGLVYAWSENFILPLSHDEVVHGKRSLLDKMPGDRWQKFANLRALYGYMWAHPGKQLLFMGGEFGQWREWSEQRPLDWHLLSEPDHAGLQTLVAALNARYRDLPALWERDSDPEGFAWIDANNADDNMLAFVRWDADRAAPVVCLCHFAPTVRRQRIGLPRGGAWRELLNTDAEAYGGSNAGNYGRVEAEDVPWHGQPASAEVNLPPLATVWLVPES